MKFSPNYQYLAAGAHDNIIYILEVENQYNLLKTIRGHTSYICCLDWDIDSLYIQTICGKNEYLFSEIESGKQVKKCSDMRNVEWSTFTCKFGWPVQGIAMGSNNPNFINSVYTSNSKQYLVTGDEDKRVNLYYYPCLRDKPNVRRYKAHSEHVKKVLFNHNDTLVISIGSSDKTILVWKVVDKKE